MVAVHVRNADERRPLAAVASRLVRALRVLGYHDAHHPMFKGALAELTSAIEAASWTTPAMTLACAGAGLMVDEEGVVLDDEPSRALAERMLQTSILAIELGAGALDRDLEALVSLLAESPERIRDAGGVRALFSPELPETVDVIEVDFAALFAGSKADLAPLVRGNAIAELALKQVLRFEEHEAAAGEAVDVRFEALATPESLGGLLDELLSEAEPGVLARPDARRPASPAPLSRLSVDELADHAVRAYVTNQSAIAGARPTDLAGVEAELAKSAEVLTNVLVRLSPDARFALLRRLAGADEDPPSAALAAIERVGAKVDDRVVVEAVAAALVDRRGDSDAVRAIGNLVRRLRPIEADRDRLLQTVDRELAKKSAPLDGVLWQELKSRATGDGALGMLELDLEAKKVELSERTAARIAGQRLCVPGQEILGEASRGRRAIDRAALGAISTLVAEPRAIPGALAEATKKLVSDLDAAGEGEAALELVQVLMKRADDEPKGPAATLVAELLVGESGGQRTAKLARLPGGESRMSGEILLRALAGPAERAEKVAMFERLASFEPEILRALATDVAEADPHRVHNLLRALLRRDPKSAVKVARRALESSRMKVKEAALRAFAGTRDRDALGLVAGVAGWKGDKVSRAMLGGLRGETDEKLLALQELAIDVLGSSGSELVVAPLVDLLTETSLFGSKAEDERRASAAKALAVLGTARANDALVEASKHAKPKVREAARRALGGRKDAFGK